MMLPDFKAPCVFCGASVGNNPLYAKEARALGEFCAQQDWHIIYGGGRIGMMGALADAALAGGGKVTGVIPGHLKDKEVAHSHITHLYVTETMHERQQKMAELADAFIVLPGGLGTLAEFFEVITWRQLGLHDKPVIIINSGGYWGGLLEMLSNCEQTGFLRLPEHATFKVYADVLALAHAILNPADVG